MNLQDISFNVEFSRVEGRVDGQVDGVLGLASVVVMDESRVGSDLVARGKPADKVFLQNKGSPYKNVSVEEIAAFLT
jgi:hypothetical protein